MARFLVDGGYTKTYEYALETMQDVGYNRWREYDAEDTIRFYALRLQEAGLIKSTPQKIIGQGTDWRFFNELKQELKGSRGTWPQVGFTPPRRQGGVDSVG